MENVLDACLVPLGFACFCTGFRRGGLGFGATWARQGSCCVLGSRDLLARVGGDEFVILLNEVSSEEEALDVCDRMHAVMRELVPLVGRDIFTSLSIGVRMSGESTFKAGDMVRDADTAMYHAKRQGGGRTTVYDQKMHRKMVERLKVQTELAYALRRAAKAKPAPVVADAADSAADVAP